MRTVKHLLLFSAAIGVAPTVARAQDIPDQRADVAGQEESLSGEIVVTARKRDESLVEVPTSITVVTAETLNNLQYREVGEFLTLSPGVSTDLSSANGLNTNITIRGVGTNDNFVEPGNAVYIDEIYASGTRTFFPAFYDIQSVQVLKGPQAGLYGRNTTGGAVVITTGQPTDDFELNAQASYARLDRLDVNGTINVPVSDFLQIRGTGWYLDQGGGYYRNPRLDKNEDRLRDVGGRLNIALVPTSFARLVVSGEYSDQKITGFEGAIEGARFGPGARDIESRRNLLRDDAAGIDVETYRISARLDVSTPIGELVVVGGHRRLEIDEPRSDYDGSIFQASATEFSADPFGYLFGGAPVPGFINAQILAPFINSRQETNEANYAEARLNSPETWDRVKLLFGLSYYDDRSTFNDFYQPVGSSATVLAAIDALALPLPRLSGSFGRDVLQETESWSGFGQAIVTLGERLEITGEVRYTRDKKQISFDQNVSGLFGFFLPNTGLNSERTFDNWSPGVTLAYRASDNVNLYAKYVQGFRAGGFNTLVNNPDNIPYEPEEAENYEVGIKGVDFGGRFNWSISAYYLRVNNALVATEDPGDLFDAFPLRNVATSTTYGLEADARLSLRNGLTLTGSVGMTSNELESDEVELAIGEIPFVPSFTASLVANYERPLSRNLTGLATVGLRHRSGGLTAEEGIRVDDFNIVDANIGVRIGDRFEIQAFGKNLLDDKYILNNGGLLLQQEAFIAVQGGEPAAFRSIRRNPGAIYGVRAAVRF